MGNFASDLSVKNLFRLQVAPPEAFEAFGGAAYLVSVYGRPPIHGNLSGHFIGFQTI
jgi:hypothetical protein